MVSGILRPALLFAINLATIDKFSLSLSEVNELKRKHPVVFAKTISWCQFNDAKLGNLLLVYLAKNDKMSEVTELSDKLPVEFAKRIEKPINSDGDTMLMCAVLYGSGQVAEFLMRRMKNVDHRNNYGGTALMCAVAAPRATVTIKFEIVKLFVGARCDIRLEDEKGRTALNYAQRVRVRTGATAIVSYRNTQNQQVLLFDNTLSFRTPYL